MKKLLYLFLFSASLGFTSCSDDDDNIQLPDIAVSFTTVEIGIDKSNSSADIAINLSRKAETDIEATITMIANDVVYGTDFTTYPVATSNNIKVNIPAGNTSASFKVSKVNGILFEGTETVKFAITSTSQSTGVVIGEKKEATLSFKPILSEGDILTLEGKSGDVTYANSVYVDFSSNTQVPIDRKNWNLGFYSGNDFKVVLNSTYATTATVSTKTDIAAITIEDANAATNIAATPMSDGGLPISVIDSFDGSLTKTVFATISATESENKVYFVASEGNKTSRDQWYKVKVNRKGAGYSVQYAKVSETKINTVEVTKDAAHNFSFLSLENGAVAQVEPEAKKWDIMWSYNIGSTGGKPYFMQDMVMSNNVGGVETVQVLTSTVSYENFGTGNLSSLTFSKDKNVIANNWRATANMGGSTDPLGVKKDRFYVIKDPNGNYYKLRFLKMGINNDGGERGRPQVEYKLIK